MTAFLDTPQMTRERAEAYGFFAATVARPLAAEDLSALRAAAAGLDSDANIGFAAVLLADPALASGDPDLRHALARDHARLFLGIAEGHGPKPPHAALWMSTEMSGPVTARIAQAFAAAGISPSHRLGPCDHIAELLTFMSRLAGDTSALALPDTVARQRDFLDAHLLSWVPAWTAAVEAAAHVSFYRVWARALSDFLRADAVFLRNLP